MTADLMAQWDTYGTPRWSAETGIVDEHHRVNGMTVAAGYRDELLAFRPDRSKTEVPDGVITAADRGARTSGSPPFTGTRLFIDTVTIRHN